MRSNLEVEISGQYCIRGLEREAAFLTFNVKRTSQKHRAQHPPQMEMPVETENRPRVNEDRGDGQRAKGAGPARFPRPRGELLCPGLNPRGKPILNPGGNLNLVWR